MSAGDLDRGARGILGPVRRDRRRGAGEDVRRPEEAAAPIGAPGHQGLVRAGKLGQRVARPFEERADLRRELGGEQRVMGIEEMDQGAARPGAQDVGQRVRDVEDASIGADDRHRRVEQLHGAVVAAADDQDLAVREDAQE